MRGRMPGAMRAAAIGAGVDAAGANAAGRIAGVGLAGDGGGRGFRRGGAGEGGEDFAQPGEDEGEQRLKRGIAIRDGRNSGFEVLKGNG